MEQLKTILNKVKALDKQQKKRALALVLAAVLVVGLAVLPMAVQAEEDGPSVSILSGTVDTGTIITTLAGGGTLTEQSGEGIRLPTNVKITEFLVENYAAVKAGDPLATVDRVSVMTAIAAVQDTLDTIKEQMNEVKTTATTGTVTAQAGGRVKAVYARAGDDAAAVMLEHGALAVLSLDGRMAVDVPAKGLATADAVTVTFSDGTAVTGRVESTGEDSVIITVEDDGYAVGTAVTVTAADGTALGSGELYIHNEWRAMAYSGTVSAVTVTAETTVTNGRVLFRLTDRDADAAYNLLARQHREYEQLMLELFVMYQSGCLTAPCDGVVTGVDHDSVHLLSASGDYSLSLLANAPNGDDETAYTNYVCKVTMVNSDGTWAVQVNPTPLSIADYTDLSAVPMDEAAMTTVWNSLTVPDSVPIYEYSGNGWVQVARGSMAAGDTLLLAGAGDSFGWIVRIAPGTAETPEVSPSPSPEVSPTPDTGTNTEDPTVTPNPSDTATSGSQTRPSGGSGSLGNGMGSGGTATEEKADLFDLAGTTILTVTPQDTMTLTITVDEADVGKVTLGMTAEITVDVLKGVTTTGTVTAMGTTGENNGGSSKFTVELTLPRGENMLGGMNAVATLMVSEAENVLRIPVAALAAQGAKTVVYTGIRGDELTAPVEVTTGVGDGEYAEITDGLTEGQHYYYAYYDTPVLDTKAE